MEALWNLEDKWKLTTKDAIAFLACTSFLVTALCIATILKRRAKIKASSLIHQEPLCMEQESSSSSSCPYPDQPQPPPPPKQKRQGIWDHDCVKTVLMSKVRWSNREKRASSTHLLGSARRWCDEANSSSNNNMNVGSVSQSSICPVWQRPILMGEKCELPRFSGLILYDQSGRPLQQYGDHPLQGSEASVTTTLKDLL